MTFIKYSFFIVMMMLFSCQSNENNTKELETKLESAVKEIENIKQQKLSDSLSKESQWNKLRDSLRLISNANNQDLSTLYESLKSSVFLVFTSDDYNLYQGSAFLINSDGTCVSNYHVFKGTNKGIVKNYRGEQFPINRIINYDIDKDFIVFQISTKNQFISPLQISTESPRVGEECFAIGSPKGLAHTLSTGIVSGFRDNGNLIQTTAEITHGSSGGALFNKKGEVIGITTSGLGEANINFAVNIKSVSYSPTSSQISASSSDAFIVTSERAYFHSQPSSESVRNAYLIRGEMGTSVEKQNGYAYIIFRNSRGQTTRGWVNLNDISFSSPTSSENTSNTSYFKVKVDKAYFYSGPSSSLRKNAYLVYGESFYTQKSENGYVYTVFTNSSGRQTVGWISISDITRQ